MQCNLSLYQGGENPLKVTAGGRHSVLGARSRMCWPCNLEKLYILFGDYVISKELKTLFKNNMPGFDWYVTFLKRHPTLASNMPEHLQKLRRI